jgi:hypothetical protein
MHPILFRQFALVALTLFGPVTLFAFNTNSVKLTASDGALSDGFGYALDLSGDTLVVSGTGLNTIYVFVREGTNWVEQARIEPPGVAYESVAISGNTLAFSLFTEAEALDAVAIYVRDGTNWVHQQTIVTPDEFEYFFGRSFALLGDSLLIGSQSADIEIAPNDWINNAGQAYLYHRTGDTWTLLKTFRAPEPKADDYFGFTVAMSSDWIAVGARDFDFNLDDGPGAIYLFVRTGDDAVYQQTLTAAVPQLGSGFPGKMDIHNDTLAVGAVLADASGVTRSGAVYVFRSDSGVWVQETILAASNKATDDRFGVSVALHEDLLVVGAEAVQSKQGAAYVFEFATTVWTETTILRPSPLTNNTFFGTALALTADYLAVGAPANFAQRGAVHLYNLSECTLTIPKLSQGDTRWATNTYDHSSNDIRARGCALTCLTMALNFAGLTNITLDGTSVTNDPGNLNAFMIDHVGNYTDNFGVNPGSSANWANTTRDASAGALVWRSQIINSVSHFAAATNFLHQTVCGLGYPVSVKVNLTNTPSHYVLVTGWDGNVFTINDPGHSDRTSLTNYNNQFETRGYVESVPVAPAPAPAPGGPAPFTVLAAVPDVSALHVSASDNVRLLITDPAGHRVGIDAAGNPFDEIPDAVHFIDEVGDDETGDPEVQSAHQIYIDYPITGTYLIAATGFQDGPYQIIGRTFTPDGSPQAPLVIEGVATNGQTSAYMLDYSSAPPATHDLAVTKLKAPKKVTLEAGTPPKPGKYGVSIQNLGPTAEVIPNATVLTQLVQLQIESLGGCAAPVPTLTAPTVFPITLAPKKKLNVSYTATIDCPNDPLTGLGHEDYRTTVTLNHAALDGQADTVPANDICPRPPNPATGDKGCAKGLEVLTDVFLKQ